MNILNVTQQAAQSAMTAQTMHELQTTLGERLTQGAMTTLMKFRHVHTTLGSMGETKTYYDLDHQLAAVLMYNNYLKEKHITIKALDKGGLRDTDIFTLVPTGLDTRPKWGDDWMILLIPGVVEAVIDLYQTVLASLPVIVDAR